VKLGAVAAPALALPEVLEEGVMIWDPHGVVLNANETMARMLGAPVDALIGSPSDPSLLLAPGGGSIPPEQLPAHRVERTKGRVDQEFGIPHADGGHVWVSVRSAPRADGTIISAYTRITEAEAKARSTARIATLVDDSPDLVWMFDSHGLIEYASPSFSATLGLRQDEVIGRLWRALTHPLDVPVLRAALADAGPDEPRTGIIEVRLRRNDGTWVWVEGQATLRFRGGSAIAVEIIGRDVSRTRAAERALASASVIAVKIDAIAPSGVGALRTANHTTVPSATGIPYSWSTRPRVRSTRAAGNCSGGIDPPSGASSIDASEGAPMIVSRGQPSIRSIAGLTSRTTPFGSQIMIPSWSADGSATSLAITGRRPSGNRHRGLCRQSPGSEGHRRACGADLRRERRPGGRRRTSWGPTRARAAGRG
jgi:PAS domain S-box-containing protein